MYGICESGYVWMFVHWCPDISEIRQCIKLQKLMRISIKNGNKDHKCISFLPLSIILDDDENFNVICKFIGGLSPKGTLCLAKGLEGGDIHLSWYDVWGAYEN